MFVEKPPKLRDRDLAETTRQLVLGGPIPVRDHEGRYLHWDDWRRRQVPDEHRARFPTMEKYWTGIKLARLFSSQALPFKDANGVPFWYCRNAMDRMASLLDRRAAGSAAMPDAAAHSLRLRQHQDADLTKESIHSSLLEGAPTTYSKAKRMLLEKRRPSSHGERMIFNNYRAMQDIARDHKNQPMSPEMIRTLHSTLTEGTLENARDEGRIRNCAQDDEGFGVEWNGKRIHCPPAWDALEGRLETLCEFANADISGTDTKEPFIHGAIRAMILHFILVHDHPFVDGNGRTARALYYWALMRQGYWLGRYAPISPLIGKHQGNYIRSFMLAKNDGGDMTYFLDFHAALTLGALDSLDGHVKEKTRELAEIEAQLRRGQTKGEWNARQLAALRKALQDPHFRFTSDYHAAEHSVSKPTALADLDKLAASGLLEKSKDRKRLVYRAARELPGMLGKEDPVGR